MNFGFQILYLGLVVFSTVQNLVGIDTVVLKICKCWYLSTMAWKCLFTASKWRL